MWTMPPVARVKGTQDFYPDDWARQIALREIMLAAGRGFGYREYEGPAVARRCCCVRS